MSKSPRPTAPKVAATAGTIISEPAFNRLAAETDGRIGVTLAQLDPNGVPIDTVTRGDWTSGPAWSTMKVPLAMAALAASDSSGTQNTVRRAITASDNAAAQRLWTDLGAGERAASSVQRQLSRRGDDATEVQPSVTRSGFSAFGQSRWDLQHQAWFAAHLVCAPSPRFVLRQMESVVPSQRWGLSRVPVTAFKGGWGPLDSGAGYTARQFGVLQTDDGNTWGIAIGSENKAGFQPAVADLNRTGDWLKRQFHLHELGISSDLDPRTCR